MPHAQRTRARPVRVLQHSLARHANARKLGALIHRVHRELTDADLQKITAASAEFSLN